MGAKGWIIFVFGVIALFLAVGLKPILCLAIGLWFGLVYGLLSPLPEAKPEVPAEPAPKQPRIDARAGLAAFTDVAPLTQAYPLILPDTEPEEIDETSRWAVVCDVTEHGAETEVDAGDGDMRFGPGDRVYFDYSYGETSSVVGRPRGGGAMARGVAPTICLAQVRVERLDDQRLIEALDDVYYDIHHRLSGAEEAAEELRAEIRVANGVPEPEARWREKAEAGDAEAQLRLGLAYEEGLGVARGDIGADAVQATELLRRAADQGLAHAEWRLGSRLAADGDKSAAAALLRRAADKAHPRAAFDLARMLHLGDGVARDLDEAARWYRAAAASADAATADAVCPVLESWGYGPAEARWLHRAEAGEAEARLCLGWAYDHGEGAPEDAGEAARWYGVAAEAGDQTARNNLACLFDAGRGVSQDLAHATRLLREAAEAGNPHSQCNLAKRLLAGRGVDKNVDEAIAWLRRASDANHAGAHFELARLYEKGEGVSQNSEQADHHYAWAAHYRHPSAMVRVGQTYERGERGRYDPATARLYYRRAARTGDPAARALLESIGFKE